jgi:hypothetical protein
VRPAGGVPPPQRAAPSSKTDAIYAHRPVSRPLLPSSRSAPSSPLFYWPGTGQKPDLAREASSLYASSDSARRRSAPRAAVPHPSAEGDAGLRAEPNCPFPTQFPLWRPASRGVVGLFAPRGENSRFFAHFGRLAGTNSPGRSRCSPQPVADFGRPGVCRLHLRRRWYQRPPQRTGLSNAVRQRPIRLAPQDLAVPNSVC